MFHFDGDPKIYDTGAGADITIIDGQPNMDEGLENAVYLSLFTESNWWGNIVAKDDSQRFDNSLEPIWSRTLTNQTRLDAIQYCKKALQWMIDFNIAKNIDVQAEIPDVGRLYIQVDISQPDRVFNLRFSVNWDNMAVRVL